MIRSASITADQTDQIIKPLAKIFLLPLIYLSLNAILKSYYQSLRTLTRLVFQDEKALIQKRMKDYRGSLSIENLNATR